MERERPSNGIRYDIILIDVETDHVYHKGIYMTETSALGAAFTALVEFSDKIKGDELEKGEYTNIMIEPCIYTQDDLAENGAHEYNLELQLTAVLLGSHNIIARVIILPFNHTPDMGSLRVRR